MRSSVRGLVLVAACIVGTFAALGVPEVAAAALIVVDNTEDFPDSDPGDGHCRGALRYAVLNRCSLRAAIQEANATPGIDNIVLEGKTYSLAQNPETPGVPGPDTITASVTITGIGRDSTTIDLGGSANIPRWRIQGFSTTARFIGLTISRGNGIIGDAGTTTFLTSSRVDRARTSGVINSVLATMTITNSVISNSQNGVGLDSAGTLTVDATSIVGNRNTTTTDPSSDGGVTINAGSATITNTVIANNTSAVQGGAGGISNRGSVLIVSSLIANNTATSSNGIGGVKNLGVMPIANSTISSNLGGLFGGISAESGPIGLVSSTVASNSPGGFRVAGGFVTGMQNVLLAQNAIQNCTGPVSVFPDPQQQQNFDSDGTCAFPPGTNFTGNPLLGPLASNGGPS